MCRDAALLFSTRYQPPYRFALRLPFSDRITERFFDDHRDLEPAAAAEILGGRIVYQERAGGLWVAILLREGIENARGGPLHLLPLPRLTGRFSMNSVEPGTR